MHLNTNYENLEQSYLFSTVAKKVNEFISKNPDKKVIRLGIGDVTLPLCKAVVDAVRSLALAVTDVGAEIPRPEAPRFRNAFPHFLDQQI